MASETSFGTYLVAPRGESGRSLAFLFSLLVFRLLVVPLLFRVVRSPALGNSRVLDSCTSWSAGTPGGTGVYDLMNAQSLSTFPVVLVSLNTRPWDVSIMIVPLLSCRASLYCIQMSQRVGHMRRLDPGRGVAASMSISAAHSPGCLTSTEGASRPESEHLKVHKIAKMCWCRCLNLYMEAWLSSLLVSSSRAHEDEFLNA